MAFGAYKIDKAQVRTIPVATIVSLKLSSGGNVFIPTTLRTNWGYSKANRYAAA
jgi:hypothetical protein